MNLFGRSKVFGVGLLVWTLMLLKNWLQYVISSPPFLIVGNTVVICIVISYWIIYSGKLQTNRFHVDVQGTSLHVYLKSMVMLVWKKASCLKNLQIYQRRFPYLKRQNSWQCQWLHFATPSKGHTAFFSIFLRLPTLLQNNITITEENITELLHNGAKSDTIQKGSFVLSILTILYVFFRESDEKILWTCQNSRIQRIFWTYFPTQILKPQFWTCPGNSGRMAMLLHCVNYRNRSRYCHCRELCR